MNSISNFKKTFILFFSLLLTSPVFAADSDVTNDVKKALVNDTTTAQSKITVDTKDGVVYLSGDVQTEAEANAAIQAASSTTDVKDVDTSKLTVTNSDHPYQDAYITAKVKGMFMREKVFGDKPIDAMDISVETKDGVVTLSGTVDNNAQIDTAINLAKKISGVKDVKSMVKAQK